MDLRANTAVDVLIGPFIDITDGNTTEDALTLTAAEIKLSKNGQALTLKSDVTAAAFDDDGYYNCELDATDTNTEGNLVLIVHQSANALPVRHEYNVKAEAAWDSLYVAKDDGFMDVNIKTIGRTDTTETQADNLETACTNYSATRGLTGTAVPAVAADGVGGLPISDAGGLDLDTLLDVAISTRMAPTVSGRTLDVTVGGTAGIDWANVENPTTALDLSGTDIQLVDTITTYTGNTVQTGDSFTLIGAAGVGLTNINLPNQTMDITGNLSGSVGSVTGAVGSVTGAVGSVTGAVGSVVGHTAQTGDNFALIGTAGAGLTDLGGMSTGMKAEVNVEAKDVLFTDTDAEPGQELPASTNTLATKIGYLFKAWRNRSNMTNTKYQLFNDDATTVDQQATVSDDATTAEKGEIATGP